MRVASFERFCPTAGVSALSRMMEQDALNLCGPRYGCKFARNSDPLRGGFRVQS
jgi:hypothetical protein